MASNKIRDKIWLKGKYCAYQLYTPRSKIERRQGKNALAVRFMKTHPHPKCWIRSATSSLHINIDIDIDIDIDISDYPHRYFEYSSNKLLKKL